MLVYCQNCGTQNADDATVCKNCGAPLRTESYQTWRERRREERMARRSSYDPCFGVRRGVSIWGIVIGLFIVMLGVTSLLGDVYVWASWDKLWPLFVIFVGILIIANALLRRL